MSNIQALTPVYRLGPLSPYTGVEIGQVAHTLAYLRKCQEMRASGRAMSLTNNPAWLVHMAINRRASWPDDPSQSRGSAIPVNGLYPRKAQGSEYMRAWRLSRDAGRVRVSEREAIQVLGKHANRVTTYGREDI